MVATWLSPDNDGLPISGNLWHGNGECMFGISSWDFNFYGVVSDKLSALHEQKHMVSTKIAAGIRSSEFSWLPPALSVEFWTSECQLGMV